MPADITASTPRCANKSTATCHLLANFRGKLHYSIFLVPVQLCCQTCVTCNFACMCSDTLDAKGTGELPQAKLGLNVLGNRYEVTSKCSDPLPARCSWAAQGRPCRYEHHGLAGRAGAERGGAANVALEVWFQAGALSKGRQAEAAGDLSGPAVRW